MTPIVALLWGALGSLATEILTILKIYQRLGRLPGRYRSLWFWTARITLIGIAGGLTVAFGPTSALQAIYIGIAAPLILERVAATSPIDGTPQNPAEPDVAAGHFLPGGQHSGDALNGAPRSLVGAGPRDT
jgi:hypothetical protein